MPRRIALALVAAAALCLSGCATYYSTPVRTVVRQAPAPVSGVSVGELLKMLQGGRPQADIIADLRARGLRVAPAPADLDVLAAAGAGPELLQALQTTGAQAGAQVANGGVAQGPIVYDPVIIQQEVYPWAPLSLGFGLGLGLGYYQGPGPWWGYPHRPGFVPYRPYGWTHPPRPIYTPFHRPHPHGGFVPRSRR
jgi:hypothetical protein